MMIMDFHCRLEGNPICKNPQCSSNIMICFIQQMSCCPPNGQCTTGWDYIHNNSLSPLHYHRLHYHRRVVLHIYFRHYSIA